MISRKKLAIDVIALILSITAIFASVYVWNLSKNRENTRKAIDLCNEFYLGQSLQRQFFTIRNWNNKHLTQRKKFRNNKKFIGASRAYGDIYNFINIVALATQKKQTDLGIIGTCFASEVEDYCRDHQSMTPDTTYQHINHLASDRNFWLSGSKQMTSTASEKCNTCANVIADIDSNICQKKRYFFDW